MTSVSTNAPHQHSHRREFASQVYKKVWTEQITLPGKWQNHAEDKIVESISNGDNLIPSIHNSKL